MKAVVFVDVQKDFIDGALRNEKAIEVTPKIVEYAKDLMANPVPQYKLYATRDTHQKTEFVNKDGKAVPVNGYLASYEGVNLPVEHCIEGTDGWMIDDRLLDVINGAATYVNKPTFGSFDLGEIIKEDEEIGNFQFDEIILLGFCTSICVVSNALLLRAKFPDKKITVIKDLCACITPESHEAALKTMQSCQITVV